MKSLSYTEALTAGKWSGCDGFALPKVGDKVLVIVNGLGTGAVLSYFQKEGWVGVMVQLDDPPQWFIRQNGAKALADVFGAECRPLP